MTVLQRVCVSGGDDVIIATIELTCAAWPGPVAICEGYENHTVTTEDGRDLQMLATGLQVALPKRDASGSQSLVFAVSNLQHEVTEQVRLALLDEDDITLTFRAYLLSDLSQPAEPPIRLTVHQVRTNNGRADITAALFDVIDTKWPRNVFNSVNAPGAASFS